MFGKLTLEAIPYHSPVAFGGVIFMALVSLAVVGGITYYRQWGYLYKEWLVSVDHKKIGIMYIILSLVMLLRGFMDALLMRLQQALAAGGEGYLPAEHFAEIFSAHGTMMIFFVLMPFLVGLMNIAVPTQIGARDVAYPFLNSVSLWLTIAAAMLCNISLAVGTFSTAGWSGYAPFSELAANPGVGVDYWIWSVQIAGIGTTLTGINFLVTIMRERAPGMHLMRMPMFCWTTLCTTILIILAFPALTVLLAQLTLDRYVGMHFFTNALGGNMMMYINLFWVWGHPEVYILILPAFGVFSEIAATYSNKRLFGYTSMVYATMAIAVLSFTVWVHHFFTMGSTPDVNAFFGITTMIIAVPTGAKIFNWLFTMYRGRVNFNLPILWLCGFIIAFTIGGMTGVMLAIPPVDFIMHNNLFLVAHFHNMLIPGSLFGFLAGYHYWFPKAFGFRLDETWGRRAFWGWFIGFFVAFMPLYALGLMGMPRRMYSYDNMAWQPFLLVAAFGALIVLFGVFSLVMQLYVSVRDRKELADVTGDPWGGRTLEWAIDSPPPSYNFAVVPTVHDKDAFMGMKENGTAYERPEQYEDIHMPSDTPAGFAIGVLSGVFGFAFVWHIWWMVILSFVAFLGIVIVRGSKEHHGFIIPAAEVKRIEDERHRKLAQAGIGADVKDDAAIDTGTTSSPPDAADPRPGDGLVPNT